MYNIRGVFEICRWSRQPKADMVMDLLYDMAESVLEKGYYSYVPDDMLVKQLTEHCSDDKTFLNRYASASTTGSISSLSTVTASSMSSGRVGTILRRMNTPSNFKRYVTQRLRFSTALGESI